MWYTEKGLVFAACVKIYLQSDNTHKCLILKSIQITLNQHQELAQRWHNRSYLLGDVSLARPRYSIRCRGNTIIENLSQSCRSQSSFAWLPRILYFHPPSWTTSTNQKGKKIPALIFYSRLKTYMVCLVHCWTLFCDSKLLSCHPASTRHFPIVGSMLGQRRRRWTNTDLTLGYLHLDVYE